MKTVITSMLIVTLILLGGKTLSGQAGDNRAQDTLSVQASGNNQDIQQKKGNQVQERSRNQNQNADQAKPGTGNGNSAKAQGNGSSGAAEVKKIKGGRPDMSKARGARPPSIVRPSGSGIPKGIGKPAGAGNRGGR